MTMTLVKGAITDKKSVLKRRKPTVRLVARLERELAQAQAHLECVRDAKDDGLRHVQEMVSRRDEELVRKNDELIQARNERDDARDERDALRNARDLINHWAQKDSTVYEQTIKELDIKLNQVREANEKLISMNRHNADVAAILVCLASADKSPAEMMLALSGIADQMGISDDILEEVRIALKRGYDAQIDYVVSGVKEIVQSSSENEAFDNAFRSATSRVKSLDNDFLLPLS